MAVQDIMLALNGQYVSTGLYSLEFRRRSTNKLISEIFFLLPPHEVSVEEASRGDVQPTLYGGQVIDFGNDFKTIVVSGQCHFYYEGNIASPKSGESPTGFNGFIEFLKLRYVALRHRDYTLSQKAIANDPDFSRNFLKSVKALQKEVNKLKKTTGGLANEIKTIWHDYDFDDHWEVYMKQASFNRSARDPFTVEYTLTMIAYSVAHYRPRQPVEVKEDAPAFIDYVNKGISNIHAESKPPSKSIETKGGVINVG